MLSSTNTTSRLCSVLGCHSLSDVHFSLPDFETRARGSIFVQILLPLSTILLLLVIRRRYFSSISSVPGPFLASFSRLWHLRHIIKGDQQLALVEQHEKHGPFVRVAHNEISVCHTEATKAVLMAPLQKGEWYKVFAFPDYRFPGPLSVVNAKEKIHSAKYLSPGFLQHNVLRSESQIDEVLRGLFGWFDHAATDHKPMELGDFFSYAAYDITGEVTFSKTFGFIEKGEDIGGAIANNEAIELFLTVFGFFRWVSYVFCNPLTTWMELLPIGHLGAITKSALEERRENPDARFDICAHWYRALGKARDVSLQWDEGRLFAAAMSNLGAGSDTLSCSLQSLIYHVIREPRVWKRLQDEVDAAVKEGYCTDPVVSHEDAQRLPYLQAAIKEALRIFAPVPMGLPRVAPKGGLTIGGVFFPEGTVLSVNPYVIMRSKEIWGPDADEFNPDRWLGPDAASLEKHFCPWGLGWAACPGQHIARIQLSKIGATMMRDYEFQQVQPYKEWEWMAYFICVPKHWPVYITKRHSK